MGVMDTACRALISQKDVFCDVFRLLLRGKDIEIREVKPLVPDLWLTEAIETSELTKQKKVQKALQLLEFKRDIIKNVVSAHGKDLDFIMFGVENQAYCDALMPARVMIYDALTLHMQMEALKGNVDPKQYHNSDDFLSGVPKGTKLKGVLTVVCYFGTKPWNGPQKLHDILDIQSPELKKLVPDYPIYIIDPHTLTDDDLGQIDTSLREVFKCLKWANSRTALEKGITSDPRFRHVSVEAAHVIQACTKLNIKPNTQQKEIDMCLAVEEWKKELLETGEKTGYENGEKVGFENGEKVGFENGKIIGFENGEQTGINTVAQNMILMGCFGLEDISRATGLSIDKIQEMKDSLQKPQD